MWAEEQERIMKVRLLVAVAADNAFFERTFKQPEGFGSYGFPESHAASFALISREVETHDRSEWKAPSGSPSAVSQNRWLRELVAV